MRYAPSDRFWRNLLLTGVFTVFTLGFSVASWNGLKVGSPTRDSLDHETGKQASAAAAGAADLATGRADYAGTSGESVKDLETVDGLGMPTSHADLTRGRGSEAAVASSTEVGGTRDLSRRGSSGSSSSHGVGLSSGGGFPGPSFGRAPAKKDYVSQKTVKTSSASAPKSSTKGNGKKGGKGTTTGTSTGSRGKDGSLADSYGGAPPETRYAATASPASTPEPLSMILVGTGLAGLYRARKYLR